MNFEKKHWRRNAQYKNMSASNLKQLM